ncbi:platelet endothelial cell adhesion molecule isoform X2 [Centropristis striata]|uniref:platelet endothelial cell adhesion molecule isoform X2 n=1 Tax=Centropristis striata TaxID=184440 RepID=UPI0027DF87CB|nr:platelet endothelial cell adhesion molecule isoform X2 [Centropristis striata]
MDLLLLLLLTSSLLSTYFHPGRTADAQTLFSIRDVSLSMEPSPDVTRDTNVTLRCRAEVISAGHEALSREYTIYKDSSVVYTKTSSSSEDLLYPLDQARVSNSGKYRCRVTIDGKQVTSDAKKLSVTGLSKPVLRLNKGVVSEGEEITANCSAPAETGSIFFYFYEGSKEILEKQVHSNQAEAKLRFSTVGVHRIHCAYTVLVTPESFKSEESNTVTVSVKALPIAAVLEVSPQSSVYEGDQLDILCSVRNVLHSSDSIQLYLSQGTKLLNHGTTRVNHSMVALAQDPAEFECRLEMGDIAKSDTQTVSVTELFSVPTLTKSPAEVFHREYMTLTCKSESFASERLDRDELTYSLDPPLAPQGPGVFKALALLSELNYTCIAAAKGIRKHSQILTVRPKVSVSTPRISVDGKVILGRPFRILCESDTGSLPITYNLMRGFTQLDNFTVEQRFQQAFFTVQITNPEEITKYMCEAKNSQRAPLLGKRLDATVIVPLAHPTLTVIPHIPEISEGDDLYLICGVTGTPPVTFKWYRDGTQKPLNISTTSTNNTDYRVTGLSKEHSGTYYCEAVNHANTVVSDKVTIEVRLALWKKALIGGFCLLGLAVLVAVLVLWFRSKRGKKEAAAELSVKPSSPKSDDSLTVNLTHDTEVYNAATGAAPIFDVSEGRGTNGARDSVASLPVDISSRSSYSIPATV